MVLQGGEVGGGVPGERGADGAELGATAKADGAAQDDAAASDEDREDEGEGMLVEQYAGSEVEVDMAVEDDVVGELARENIVSGPLDVAENAETMSGPPEVEEEGEENLNAFIDDDYFTGEDGNSSDNDEDDESWYTVSSAEKDAAAARRAAASREQKQADTTSATDTGFIENQRSSNRNGAGTSAPLAAAETVPSGLLDLGAVDAASRNVLSASGYARVLNIDVDQGGALETDEDNNQLFSGIGFDVMLESEEFVKTLNTDFGFHTCTHVQLVAMPRIAEGEDIVMQSYTGTGKTLAFLLPLLERIDPELAAVQAVVVAPTRELAVQIANECARLCANTAITSTPLIGGANPQRQVDKLRRSTPHVVIGTPGRLAELSQNRVLRLRKTRMVVVDEVDQCLEDAFRIHLEAVLSSCPGDRQLVFCSATGDKDIVRRYAQKWMREPALLRFSGKQKVPSNISHWSTVVPARLRIDIIRKLIYTKDPPISAICFVDDPRRVDIVCERLYAMKVPAGALRGNAHKLERAEVIRLFRKGAIRLLVTTEVAARGLDVPAVSHVFNLDLPTDADHYIHRAGRCGRAGAVGTVVSIASPDTAFVIRRLEQQLEVGITPMEVRGGEYVPPFQRIESEQRSQGKGRVPHKDESGRNRRASPREERMNSVQSGSENSRRLPRQSRTDFRDRNSNRNDPNGRPDDRRDERRNGFRADRINSESSSRSGRPEGRRNEVANDFRGENTRHESSARNSRPDGRRSEIRNDFRADRMTDESSSRNPRRDGRRNEVGNDCRADHTYRESSVQNDRLDGRYNKAGNEFRTNQRNRESSPPNFRRDGGRNEVRDEFRGDRTNRESSKRNRSPQDDLYERYPARQSYSDRVENSSRHYNDSRAEGGQRVRRSDTTRGRDDRGMFASSSTTEADRVNRQPGSGNQRPVRTIRDRPDNGTLGSQQAMQSTRDSAGYTGARQSKFEGMRNNTRVRNSTLSDASNETVVEDDQADFLEIRKKSRRRARSLKSVRQRAAIEGWVGSRKPAVESDSSSASSTGHDGE
jgi:ATP-dependent RNA helicase DeaD